ncbi:MAG: hypothetical protein ABJQ85_15805 [Rhizobiaceae bacterium]
MTAVSELGSVRAVVEQQPFAVADVLTQDGPFDVAGSPLEE